MTIKRECGIRKGQCPRITPRFLVWEAKLLVMPPNETGNPRGTGLLSSKKFTVAVGCLAGTSSRHCIPGPRAISSSRQVQTAKST